MSTKIKIILWVSTLVIALGLVAGYFYWFQWRTSKIRKDCFRLSNVGISKDPTITTQVMSELYNRCLHMDGLEK